MLFKKVLDKAKELGQRKVAHIRNTLEDMGSAFHAGMKAGQLDVTLGNHEYLDDIGVQVYLCDDLVTAHTGVSKYPCASVNLVGIFVNKLLVDDPKLYDAVIAHEVGHRVIGHQASGMSILGRTLGSTDAICKELEADAYAVQQGHKEGLLEYLEGYRTFTKERYGKSSKELDIRISGLKY